MQYNCDSLIIALNAIILCENRNMSNRLFNPPIYNYFHMNHNNNVPTFLYMYKNE